VVVGPLGEVGPRVLLEGVVEAVEHLDCVIGFRDFIDLEWISKDTYLEVSNPPSSATYGD
jgi:hypothetical protein